MIQRANNQMLAALAFIAPWKRISSTWIICSRSSSNHVNNWQQQRIRQGILFAFAHRDSKRSHLSGSKRADQPLLVGVLVFYSKLRVQIKVMKGVSLFCCLWLTKLFPSSSFFDLTKICRSCKMFPESATWWVRQYLQHLDAFWLAGKFPFGLNKPRLYRCWFISLWSIY